MCGIAGLIFDELDPRGGELLTAMTQSMYHRGPDGGGAVIFGLGGRPVIEQRLDRPGESVKWDYLPVQVGLGARRLAILDPSEAGHQPMSGGDGQAWIVFNGAIYNFRALREQLGAAGMTFRGGSDTEVLLAAYRHWGIACFERLEGMWGLAIYEPAAGRIVICRDRLGIKPLYIARYRGGLAFASEIGAILTLPGFPRETEAGVLRDFLTRGLTDHTDRTFFESIWSVPAGCYVAFDLRTGVEGLRGTLHRYWNPELRFTKERLQVDRVTQSLEQAVKVHLISDVPVGSCLSGGLDSSLVVCMAHEATSGFARTDDINELITQWSQHVFTACLPGDPLDESRFAEIVVRDRGNLNWHRALPTAAGLLAELASLVRHQEQPFGSPSIYMQWEVMRLARETGVTVLLDGQGGDELFCGYEGCIPPFLADLLRRARLLRFVHELLEARRAGWYRLLPLFAHVGAHLLPEFARRSIRKTVDRSRHPWLAGDLFSVDTSQDLCDGLGIRGGDAAALDPDGSLIDRFQWNLLIADSLPSLLRFEDRNSMAFSIEARVPFLDRSVVELAMSIPAEEKIRDGRLKSILREAAGCVPAEIINRRDKIGFSAPTAGWMREGLRPWWEEAVNSQSFHDRGCFDRKGVAKLVARFNTGDDLAALPLWRLAVVEQWARQFMDVPVERGT